MKIKRLPGTFGVGIVWDGFTRSLIVSVLVLCLKFSWPRVGQCQFCPHGPGAHRARRDHGMIEWRCVGGPAACPCQHYEPERAS